MPSPFSAEALSLASETHTALRRRGWKLATAESCTGGLIAALLTEIAGASDVLDRGFVTYSNAAKSASLGVAAPLIDAHGAVSEPVARAMAEGALAASGTSIAVAVTGVAGPAGATATKPVGLVYVAVARIDGPTCLRELRLGEISRSDIRVAAALEALRMVRAAAAAAPGLSAQAGEAADAP